MNVIINGAAGRMGQQVIAAVSKAGHTIVAAVDQFYSNQKENNTTYPCFGSLAEVKLDADCVIDFSNHLATIPLLDFAKEKRIPVMLATTGQTDEEKKAIIEASKIIPIFRSANMSLGIATLCSLLKTAVTMFPDADIEIIEQHHNQKLDVPSGTALILADVVRRVRENSLFVVGRHENGKRKPEEVGIHSIRLGNVVGIHEILITTGNETITLKHEAHSRAVFADGAVKAAEFLMTKVSEGKTSGLFTMDDLVASFK